MFKVGDKVVYLSKIAPEHDDIYEIYHLSEDSCFMSHLGFDYKAMFEYIRHATPEEIAAGHRIDNDMGDDSHIENHISKNCKVIDYD